MPPRQLQRVARCDSLRHLHARRHLAPEERRAMFPVSQVHLEANPLTIFENAHPPGPFDGVRELPEYVIPFLVREAFAICLDDAADLSEDQVLHFAEDVSAVLFVRAAQKLKGVDRLHSGKILGQPCCCAGGFAVHDLFEELFNLFRDQVAGRRRVWFDFGNLWTIRVGQGDLGPVLRRSRINSRLLRPGSPPCEGEKQRSRLTAGALL